MNGEDVWENNWDLEGVWDIENYWDSGDVRDIENDWDRGDVWDFGTIGMLRVFGK